MFLALDPADDAPCPVPMGKSKRYCLGTLLRNPIMVMLINLAQVSAWPRKDIGTQDSFQGSGKAGRPMCARSSQVQAPPVPP